MQEVRETAGFAGRAWGWRDVDGVAETLGARLLDGAGLVRCLEGAAGIDGEIVRWWDGGNCGDCDVAGDGEMVGCGGDAETGEGWWR